MTTPAEELRTAAAKLSPSTTETPNLTAEYPDLDAAYAQLLRGIAETVDAVLRHYPDAIDERAHWLAPALAVARAINGGQS